MVEQAANGSQFLKRSQYFLIIDTAGCYKHLIMKQINFTIMKLNGENNNVKKVKILSKEQ